MTAFKFHFGDINNYQYFGPDFSYTRKFLYPLNFAITWSSFIESDSSAKVNV